MITDSEYVSPDGSLRFLVRLQDGDITIGFDGTPWHTHGDMLATISSQTPDDAVESFIKKLIAGELIIAVSNVGGKIRNVWITENPPDDLRYCPPDEHIDFRLWDGTKILP